MVQSQRRTFCAPSNICHAIESSAWCSSPVSFPVSAHDRAAAPAGVTRDAIYI